MTTEEDKRCCYFLLTRVEHGVEDGGGHLHGELLRSKRSQPRPLQRACETPRFIEFALRLSRACLGTPSLFFMKMFSKRKCKEGGIFPFTPRSGDRTSTATRRHSRVRTASTACTGSAPRNTPNGISGRAFSPPLTSQSATPAQNAFLF
jgi:hypothetical protein